MRFTFTDLVILIVLLALVAVPAGVSTIAASSGSANRIKCGSNLRQIGQAMRMYAIDNVRIGAFPRTRHDPDNPAPTVFTGIEANEPFAEDGPAFNDVTAAYFLLLREYDLVPLNFLCSDDFDAVEMEFADGLSKHDYANFRGRNEVSFSFANPYPSREVMEAGFKWADSLGSTFALAADRHPGTPEVLTVGPDVTGVQMRQVNSANHYGEGQNVLFADGSVRFVMTPYEGHMRDNIWTSGKPTPENGQPFIGVAVAAAPMHQFDSVLLPLGDPAEHAEALRRRPRDGGLSGQSLFVAALVAMIAALLLWAARRGQVNRSDPGRGAFA